MNNGVLRYRGRKQNPATFKSNGKDLRQLVAHCACGAVMRGKAAIPLPDSYHADIDSDYTPVVQCPSCNATRAEDI